ncbi:MAG: methylenetetrahydrofolate reductase C-terminal domain-containing protein [Actinomycetota bacterium]|nr:methylenetetrahydrofolate reductase C-terminal domain-containing protein [Actinomycetota bacterium]
MIGQVKKPIKEVLGYLEGKRKIVIYGCGGCATLFQTGGEIEVNKMEKTLVENGKEVLAAIGVPFGEFSCYAPWAIKRIYGYREELKNCDAVLMLSCGDGLQVMREIIEKEFGLVKPIYPATNPMGHMGGGPGLFKEKCIQCGDCELGKVSGICPLTQCPKGLLNGPCGGVRKGGKCEVNPDMECAWVQIYRRLKELGELEKMDEILPPKDWSKTRRPRELEVEPLSPR